VYNNRNETCRPSIYIKERVRMARVPASKGKLIVQMKILEEEVEPNDHYMFKAHQAANARATNTPNPRATMTTSSAFLTAA
jgi:hypothetical protein